MPVTRIGSRWRYGFQEFYEVTRNETIETNAPIQIFDDFNGLEVDTVNDWNEAIVNGSTTTANNGWMTLTTGATNDDDHEVASELVFTGTNYCVMEARLRNDDVANTAVCIGLVDATAYAADTLAVTYAGDTLVTTATDGAVFIHDKDTTADTWRAVCVDTDVDGAILDTAITPVNSQIQNFRIEIDASGFCYFWFSTGTDPLQSIGSDILVGVTPGTALCAYVGYITREAFVNTCDVDYIRAWGGR